MQRTVQNEMMLIWLRLRILIAPICKSRCSQYPNNSATMQDVLTQTAIDMPTHHPKCAPMLIHDETVLIYVVIEPNLQPRDNRMVNHSQRDCHTYVERKRKSVTAPISTLVRSRGSAVRNVEYSTGRNIPSFVLTSQRIMPQRSR
jgi:hypothetical protein